MPYIPSLRIQELQRVEQAGVWIDRSSTRSELWMVSKMPMNVIRAIHWGASVKLCAWVVEIDNQRFAVFGLRVDDNPDYPWLFYGACRSTDQVNDLRELLCMSAFPLQIHNELFFPVLYAGCKSVPETAYPVIEALPVTGDFPETQGISLRQRALDVVEATFTPNSHADTRLKANCTVILDIECKNSLKTYVAGSGIICLDDLDEGNELERLGFQAFEYLCPFGTVHQPLVQDGAEKRELCDILAVSRIREKEDEGVFIIQSKVASETHEGLKRTNERRSASIQKNIMKAIRQLRGAVKRLRAGNPVFYPDGTLFGLKLPNDEAKAIVEPLDLQERANNVGHGIVLISDMHEGADWKKIAEELIESSRSANYMFHVLDLRELQRLVSYSKGRPAMLEGFLVRRWLLMEEHKSALVRSQFIT